MNFATVNQTQWPAAKRFMVEFQKADGIAGMYFRDPEQVFFYSDAERQNWISRQRDVARAKNQRLTITEFERAQDGRAVVNNCNLF